MKKFFSILFPTLALLCSCEELGDDYYYPSVVTDYTCLLTNASGQPHLLRLDNGSTYPITFADEADKGSVYKADTTYRIISIYELGADSIALIHSMANTVSHIPTTLRSGETLHQDPAYLESCWLSGGFLNMVIELKALDGKHNIGFIDTTPTSMKGKEFTFYHRIISDVEAYRQKLYGSIPLKPFNEELQQGDTLRFVINTYNEGVIVREFVM